MMMTRHSNNNYFAQLKGKMYDMKIITGLLFFSAALALIAAPSWAESANTEHFPSAIATPANQVLKLTLFAHGDQVYECRCIATTPDKFGWMLREPDADLFDESGAKVGHHSGGPKWELNSGDKVNGQLRSKVQSPDGKGIPWLLLDAKQASGPKLGKIVSIQRVDTVGGQEPDEPVDSTQLGQTKRVKYDATYKFYTLK